MVIVQISVLIWVEVSRLTKVAAKNFSSKLESVVVIKALSLFVSKDVFLVFISFCSMFIFLLLGYIFLG